jgi:ribosomal protein L37E
VQEEDKKKLTKPTGEMEGSKDSGRSGVDCPQCGNFSYFTWILDQKHGLCASCGNHWAIKESS